MNVLALDLGTKTGYAILYNGEISSGVKKLPQKTFGSRFAEFRSWLMRIISQNKIDLVCFERVYRHNGTEAAHVFGGFMYMLAAVCDKMQIACEGFSVGSIKKFMTGKGNANKEEMIRAAYERGFDPIDDNEADALGVLLIFLDQRESKPPNAPSGQIFKSTKNAGPPCSTRVRGSVPHDLASVRTFSEVDERDAHNIDCLPGGPTCRWIQ